MSDPSDKTAFEADQNERTNAVGLYHYAQSYRSAAGALGTIETRSTHPDAPQQFLYSHAIELFLKSYLRNAGLTVMTLKNLSHSTGELKAAFLKHGGFLKDEASAVLDIMERTDAISRARYIVTGYFHEPPMQALARTAKSVAKTVRDKLKASGLPVR